MKRIFVIILCLQISSCTLVKNDSNNWDFDHDLQFNQQQLSENVYQVVIHRKKNTRFTQLSSFLLRHALEVCQVYGFKLELLEGVEGFYDKQVAKSYIQPDLKAIIECPKK
ncbi:MULTISPECIES: hypothetical protein [Thalassotalea]|uniref:Uncharacterized protein n=1 Tax=Thalassotalea castellviae TaxID=3075612 RepID=A0ABU2ZZN1_9GAMM|nr:hypothetical protein [Thalassotalea sp. W431]MDT0603385.1 hypothetical protein [Thalassotalea sp. W431]